MVDTTIFKDVYGDQRHIYVQIKMNKRRYRRSGKEETPFTLPILERVYHVFKTGKIIDYIHPREIDPYWGILYKQFEYLTYCEMLYRNKLESCYDTLPKHEINFIFLSIFRIEKYKQDLVIYMLHFMQLLYGSVMKNRFWGFSKNHGEEFISMFKFLVLKNIKELKFDVNKTRCSVYYYQLLWLSGIGLTKEIRDKYKREKLKNDEGNRGTPIYSKGSKYNEYAIPDSYAHDIEVKIDEDEDLIEKLVSTLHNTGDEYTEIHNEYFNEDYASSDENIFGDISMTDFTIESKNGLDVSPPIEAETHYVINEIKVPMDSSGTGIDSEPDDESQRLSIINRLLDKLDISQDLIYKITDKEISKIGKHIRKMIKKGKIKFSDSEIKLLQKYFKND